MKGSKMCGQARANLLLPNVQVGVEVPKPRVKTMGEAGSLASTAKVWSVLVVSASGTTARDTSQRPMVTHETCLATDCSCLTLEGSDSDLYEQDWAI